MVAETWAPRLECVASLQQPETSAATVLRALEPVDSVVSNMLAHPTGCLSPCACCVTEVGKTMRATLVRSLRVNETAHLQLQGCLSDLERLLNGTHHVYSHSSPCPPMHVRRRGRPAPDHYTDQDDDWVPERPRTAAVRRCRARARTRASRVSAIVVEEEEVDDPVERCQSL